RSAETDAGNRPLACARERLTGGEREQTLVVDFQPSFGGSRRARGVQQAHRAGCACRVVADWFRLPLELLRHRRRGGAVEDGGYEILRLRVLAGRGRGCAGGGQIQGSANG